MYKRHRNARLLTGGLIGVPPGYGDEHWDDVTLLLNGSSAATDLSNQDASITNTGSVGSVPVTGPTGYGTVDALSFNGTDQCLTSNHYSASLYNQDFTIEGWFYIDTSASTALFSHRESAPVADGPQLYTTSGGQFGLVVGDGTSFFIFTATAGSVTVGGWQHLALVRSGDNYTVYKDGQSIITATGSNTVTTSGRFILMGGYATDSTHGQLTSGDVFDFRITEGVARYTSNFTPPTASFPTALAGTPGTTATLRTRGYIGAAPAADAGDEYWDDVVLLLDGTDPATDLSIQQQTVTETGSSTGFSNETDPFGKTQDVLDFSRTGSGSGYEVSSSPITFGSSPFTIEMWIKLDSANLTQTQVLYSERSAGTTCVTFRVAGQKLVFFKDNSAGGILIGATTLVADTWYHVALTYDGSTVRLFLDGQLDGSSNQSLTFNPNVTPVLGYDRAFPETTYQLDGRMAQVRITKGVARYTADFSSELPTASFPTNVPQRPAGMLTLYDRYVDTLG
jgi:hypothetical protein